MGCSAVALPIAAGKASAGTIVFVVIVGLVSLIMAGHAGDHH